jgi:hypothetical protein
MKWNDDVEQNSTDADEQPAAHETGSLENIKIFTYNLQYCGLQVNLLTHLYYYRENRAINLTAGYPDGVMVT